MSKPKIVRNLPVAKFFYKGNHTHPVRRTVLVIESNKEMIKGYEIREGTVVRLIENAPIKSYKLEKIAKGENLRKENPIRKKKPKKTTLVRKNLIDLAVSGI